MAEVVENIINQTKKKRNSYKVSYHACGIPDLEMTVGGCIVDVGTISTIDIVAVAVALLPA